GGPPLSRVDAVSACRLRNSRGSRLSRGGGWGRPSPKWETSGGDPFALIPARAGGFLDKARRARPAPASPSVAGGSGARVFRFGSGRLAVRPHAGGRAAAAKSLTSGRIGRGLCDALEKAVSRCGRAS